MLTASGLTFPAARLVVAIAAAAFSFDMILLIMAALAPAISSALFSPTYFADAIWALMVPCTAGIT